MREFCVSSVCLRALGVVRPHTQIVFFAGEKPIENLAVNKQKQFGGTADSTIVISSNSNGYFSFLKSSHCSPWHLSTFVISKRSPIPRLSLEPRYGPGLSPVSPHLRTQVV